MRKTTSVKRTLLALTAVLAGTFYLVSQEGQSSSVDSAVDSVPERFARSGEAMPDVVLGDERADVYLPFIDGRRVALFSNHSGIAGDRSQGLKYPAGRICEFTGGKADVVIDEESMLAPFGTPAVKVCSTDSDARCPDSQSVSYGPHILDVLLEQGVNVTAIFSPEHGFRGEADAGADVPASIDSKTGIPILSLYSNGDHKPSDEDMSKFDVLVVDIQDVGLRYYTYYITMHHLIEACALLDKSVVVLDRPNPNGFYVDGAVLDMQFKSGIGWLPIPTVHGMTMGELALMMVGEGWVQSGGNDVDLHVVPCLNYSHRTLYRLLKAPSPNLKDMKSIYLYSSTCCFEGTSVTAGRGTPWPFEIYGSPDATPDDTRPVFSFTPCSMPGARNPRFLGRECYGRDLRGVPTEDILSNGINMEYVIDAYRSTGSKASFFGANSAFEKRVGASWIAPMIENGASAQQIEAHWQADVDAFKQLRRKYLLYTE